MNHIPIEILHEIFIQLKLKDRLECMLVCQLWHDTLDRHSLLHTLDIHDNVYPKFMDMLECLSYRGKQVEKLALDISVYFNKRKLCNMFPNLRELKLRKGRQEGIQTHDHISKKFHFIYPTTKLEIIEDFGQCELASQLAKSNLCNQLKVLKLDLTYFIDSTNVISQLKNMPSLETLHLSRIGVKLMDLEMLHGNLGSIKDFGLDEVMLLSGEIPHDVKPATLITGFGSYVESAADLNTHVQFYKYIHKKYPSLSHPTYSDSTLTGEGEYYVREVYTKGIFPLYQNIGSQIQSFQFETYCSGLDAFRRFDEYNVKLKYLQIKSHDDNDLFLEELAQSNQAKYIQNLNLEDVLPLPVNRLNCMEALQFLNIDFLDASCDTDYRTRQNINFRQLIEACPATLSTLNISYVDLTFGELPLNLTCINDLRLRHIDLTPPLAKILEANFPKLSKLYLSGTLTNNLTISLPNHDLDFFGISTDYEEGQRHGFLVKTTNDDKVQYHAQRRSHIYSNSGPPYTINKVVPVLKEEFDDPLVLNFICSSVKELHLSTSIKNCPLTFWNTF